MSDKIVFTAIFGNYDRLQPISAQGWRCICFTDGDFQVRGWEIIKMEPYAKAFRHIKTCPHLFLPKHSLSVWIDGNITPKFSMSLITRGKVGYHVMVHPTRKSLWDEAERCKELNKDDHAVIDRQMARYKEEGYPNNIPVVATGVLIRSNQYDKFNEAWWEEIKNGSVRDQLSFPYVCWKLNHKFHKFPFLKDFKKVLHDKRANHPVTH